MPSADMLVEGAVMLFVLSRLTLCRQEHSQAVFNRLLVM